MTKSFNGPIEKRSFFFALEIIKTFKVLTEKNREYIMSKQLLRSGTAVGALVREAQNAESKKDFIHKLAIAQKECDESIYWIDLLAKSEFINEEQKLKIGKEAHVLLNMIKSAIVTTRNKFLTPKFLSSHF